MKPANAIGGDLYDFMEMPNGRLGIVIADIAGNGVSAGLFMPAVKIALRTNIRDEASLERILKKTNQIIYELTDHERFAFSFTRPSILLRAICLTSSRKADRCHL